MNRPRSKALTRRLLLAVVVLIVLRQWVWMPVLIVGSSMEPTLHQGQLAGVNKLAYRLSAPSRGDVVTVWTGNDFVLKRIVGMPTEEVAIKNGIVEIDGRRLNEPYVRIHGLNEIASGRIPQDCFMIAGDNRSETFIGIVHRSRIVGRLTRAPLARHAEHSG